MIKVLLFDFYGVFLPDAFSVWLQVNNVTRKGAFATLIHRRDEGVITEAEFLHGLSEALGREVTIDEIHKQRHEPDTGLIDLVRSLKSQYRICLFSNASPRLHKKLKTLGIVDLFDEVIISSEIGHAKPSDEAFTIAINTTGFERGEILFIDDSLENYKAALKNGLYACHYQSIDNLYEALHLLGWKKSSET